MAGKLKAIFVAASFILTAAVAVTLTAAAQGTAANGAQAVKRIPAFHSAPPTKPLGNTLDPKQ